MRLLLIPLLLVIVLASYANAASVVLGIDLGTEYIKAALVKPGIPLEIVLTKDSKRKEASAIGFKPSRDTDTLPTRLYGSDAVNLAARFPANVFPNLKQLLGKSYDSPELATYTKRYPALSIEKDDNGRIIFNEPASGKKMHVEELLAMQFRAVIKQAEAMAAGSRVQDVVFTIPGFYGAEEKNSLLLAAELAGLKTLNMITDGMAVGLNYATTRTFKKEVPEYHIVFDMGAGSTTATVLRFQGKSVPDVGRYNKTVTEVEVLGIGYDRTLGGDLFNEIVVDLLVKDFASKKGKDIGEDKLRADGRAASKLWREATRVRQILSANTETVSSVESLIDEIDFRSGKITRHEYEEGLQKYGARVAQPLWDAITQSNLKSGIDMISTVIVHGGATRTPYIQRYLENMFGPARVSKNVNSDEAAVFGATFRGAGLSGAFRVKDIRASDSNPYAVVGYFPDQKPMTLFVPGSAPSSDNIIEVPANEAITVELHHHEHFGDFKEPVSKIDAVGVADAVKALQDEHKCEETSIVAKLNFRLNKKTGLPILYKAWAECKKIEMETPEDESVLKKAKGWFGKKDKDSSSSSSSSSSSKSSKSASKDKKSGSSSTSSSSTSATATPTLKTYTKNVKLSTTKLTAPRPTKQPILSQIALFDAHDASLLALEETRNNLESLVYRAREKLLPIPDLLSEPELTALEESLSSAGDWLYEEGFTAPLETVKARYNELKDKINPVEARKREIEQRPQMIEDLKKSLETAEQVGLESVKEIKQWLEEKEATQSGRKAWEEMVLSVKELEGKMKKIEEEVRMVMIKKVEEEAKKMEAERKAKKEKEEMEKKRREQEEKEEKEEFGNDEKTAEEKAEEVVKEEKKEQEQKEQEEKVKGHDEL